MGCVAHLLPVKGHLTLIQAVAPCPASPLSRAAAGPGLRGLPAARGPRRDLARRVEFLGEVRDVPAFLAELDMFALPTWAEWRMEGSPVALLEAMSCGRACVATDIPGSRDIVDSGRSGIVVPPRDADALAQALGRLASDAPLRQELGTAARARVLDAFSIDREVRAHEDLYAEALGLREAIAA